MTRPRDSFAGGPGAFNTRRFFGAVGHGLYVRTESRVHVGSFSKDSHSSAKPRETSELDVTLKVRSTSIWAAFKLEDDVSDCITAGEGDESISISG